MKYYKLHNEVFAFESDGSQDHLIKSEMVLMSDEEVELHINPPKTPEQLHKEAKAEALAYLASTDWYVARYSETNIAIPDNVKTKRQEARSAING